MRGDLGHDGVTQPGLDPDRASFTVALQAARDQFIQATGVLAGTTIDLRGTIGRHILASLMPVRRMRVNARTVKRAISKYNARGPSIDRRTYTATTAVGIPGQPHLATNADP